MSGLFPAYALKFVVAIPDRAVISVKTNVVTDDVSV